MTHISIVLPSLLPLGGAERLAITIAEDQINRGNKVDLVLMNNEHDLKGVLPEAVRVVTLNVKRIRSAILPLAKYLKATKPDVMLVSMWPLTSVSVISKMMARSKTNLIISEHNPLSIQYRHWGRMQNIALKLSTKLTHRFANSIVAVSKGVANDLSELSGLVIDKITVIYNPIKLPDAKSSSQDSELWGDIKAKRIVSVGNLKDQKNHMMLIRAFKKVLEKQDAHLMILGAGALEDKMRALVFELGIRDKVSMPGHVPSPADYYNTADLFVLSSDYEGFGNVIVEAMACGLPVVSTDCPYGPSEILDGGKYGKLVPVGDDSAMANAIVEALDETVDAEILKARAEKLSGAESLNAYQKLFAH